MVAYKKGTKGYELQEKRKRETMLKKYGGEAGTSEFFKKIGAQGGMRKVKKGFACMSAEKRAEAGRKGGTISRRGKAKQ